MKPTEDNRVSTNQASDNCTIVFSEWLRLFFANDLKPLRWACVGMYAWLCLVETITVFHENRRIDFIPPVVQKRIWPPKQSWTITPPSEAAVAITTIVDAIVPECSWCDDTGRLYGRSCPVCRPAADNPVLQSSATNRFASRR